MARTSVRWIKGSTGEGVDVAALAPGREAFRPSFSALPIFSVAAAGNPAAINDAPMSPDTSGTVRRTPGISVPLLRRGLSPLLGEGRGEPMCCSGEYVLQWGMYEREKVDSPVGAFVPLKFELLGTPLPRSVRVGHVEPTKGFRKSTARIRAKRPQLRSLRLVRRLPRWFRTRLMVAAFGSA